MSIDAESLIAHLANALVPADRDAFRQAVENALATSPICLGPGSIYRTVTAIWRIYFHPSPDRGTTWTSGKRNLSKLITEPPPKDCRVRRRVRIVR